MKKGQDCDFDICMAICDTDITFYLTFYYELIHCLSSHILKYSIH